MINDNDIRLREEWVKDRMREVAHDRVVDIALAGKTHRAMFYHAALARIGTWLIIWGMRLQARYSVAYLEHDYLHKS